MLEAAGLGHLVRPAAAAAHPEARYSAHRRGRLPVDRAVQPGHLLEGPTPLGHAVAQPAARRRLVHQPPVDRRAARATATRRPVLVCKFREMGVSAPARGTRFSSARFGGDPSTLGEYGQ